jgi:hypothetical protein
MKLEEIIKGYEEKVDAVKLTKTFNGLKKRFEASGLNVDNISLALISIMTEVKKIKTLRGSEKKQLVISVLNNFVEDICPGDDTPLELILKQMIPTLIDNIVEMSKIKPPKWCFTCIKT